MRRSELDLNVWLRNFCGDWFWILRRESGSTFFLLTCSTKTGVSIWNVKATDEFDMWFSAAGIEFFDVENGDVENILDFDVKNRVALSFSWRA